MSLSHLMHDLFRATRTRGFRRHRAARLSILGLCILSGGALAGLSGCEFSAGEGDRDLGDAQLLHRASQAFNRAAQKAMPAVVSIQSIKARVQSLPGNHPAQPVSPWDDPAGFRAGNGGGPLQKSEPGESAPGMPALGVGSGVILRTDGTILTNYHVVENAERILVALGGADGTVMTPAQINGANKHPAVLIGADPRSDLAVIRLQKAPAGLRTIAFGDSDAVKIGDWVLAVGSPFGLNHTVTSGIISAKSRGPLGVYDVEDFLQTDAAINPGNSGGPLLNVDGEMVGINSAIYSHSGASIGIGFSITSKLAHQIADELIAHGKVTRGWLGVMAQDLDPDLAAFFKAPSPAGALVSHLDPRGPGAKAGLAAGDVVVGFGDSPVRNSADFKSLVMKAPVGEAIKLSIVRDGKPKFLTANLTEAPGMPADAIAAASKQQAGRIAGPADLSGDGTEDGAGGSIASSQRRIGVVVQNVPTELAPMLKLPSDSKALVVGVMPGSLAFDSGVQPGDVILRANQQTIKTAEEFVSFAKERNRADTLVLYVQRGPDRRLWIPLAGAQ